MSETIKVLFLAAEADPFVKVGGLGDVAGSLPQAIRGLSNEDLKIDIRLVFPYHPVIKSNGYKPLGIYTLPRKGSEVEVEAFETEINGMPVYLINGEMIRSSGSVYSSDAKLDAEKYSFFSLAALRLANHINWLPDVIHANDWHTALGIYGSLTKRWEEGARHVAGVLSVHNLPYMGPDVSAILESYGYKLAQTDLPEWARVMPLPLGLWASDAIVAVSPSYGNEILGPEHGCGLDEFLQLRRDTVSGILNGIDIESFNPAEDPALGVNFDAATLDKRITNKGILQEKVGLPRNTDTPLIAIVSRMDNQKGVDIAISALKSLKTVDLQAVILGTGDPKLEDKARELQQNFPEKIKVELRFDAGLARQIYAGADMLLMPSRYEPCGLSQMIAMRYGCVPVVRAVGGLNDTVKQGETGFVFEKAHHLSLMGAIRTALKHYDNKSEWKKIQLTGMSQDFSWKNSAMKYVELYKSLIKK